MKKEIFHVLHLPYFLVEISFFHIFRLTINVLSKRNEDAMNIHHFYMKPGQLKSFDKRF